MSNKKISPCAGKASGGNENKQNSSISVTAEQFRAVAQEYIDRGWHPIPLAAPERGKPDTGKAPTLRAWQKHQTAAVEVERFWPDGSRANMGLNLGPSRLVVLDFDEAAAYLVWAGANPLAAKTYTVSRDNAPTGRCHLYFTLLPGQPAPSNLAKAATGWGDLLSVGRQVVAPPSLHYTGGRYVVTNDIEPIMWHDAYTPELWGKNETAKLAPEVNPEPGSPDIQHTPDVPPSVLKRIWQGASEGERNSTAFAIACQSRDAGNTEVETLKYLEVFAGKCSPPMARGEVLSVLKSVYTKPPREPARKHSAVQIDALIGLAEQTSADAWPQPEPLGDLDFAPPPWPWYSYPQTFSDFGQAIASTMNVPEELPGLTLLCAASIASRKICRVAIKQDHLQYPNIYGMVAMPAATGKSPATRPIMAPLIAHQINLRKNYHTAMREWLGRNKVARAQIASLEKEAKSPDANAFALAAKISELEAIEGERPAQPILIADNATSEALARTLADNGGKLGIFTADGRDVLSMARGRYTKDSDDVSVWLKAHAGDYLAYHRSDPNKLPFECPEPILSAFVAVQPDALQVLGTSKALRDSGFLARWLYCVPQTNGMVEYPDRSIPDYLLEDYKRTIHSLLAMVPIKGDHDEPIPHTCVMPPDARAAWIAMHDDFKRQALSASPLLASCLGKLPEHLARIALLLCLLECAEENQSPALELSPQYVERAGEIGAVLLAHIRRAVALMGDSGERTTARELWPILDANRDKLLASREAEGLGRIEAVKPRDVARYRWAGIETTGDARAALTFLEVRGWLRLRKATAKSPAARDHELYELYRAA